MVCGMYRWLDVIPSELIPAGLGVTKTVFYIDNSVSAQVILCKTYSAEITVLCIEYTLCVKHIALEYLTEGRVLCTEYILCENDRSDSESWRPG